MTVLTHFLLWRLGLAKAETQTTDAERAALARYAADRRCIVEIGVWHGVTTCVLRRAMAAGGTLYAVDPFPVGRLGFSAQRVIAHREVGRIARGTVEWVEATGVDAAARHTTGGRPPVDFLFVDGDHGYDAVRGDWEAWSGLIAQGGVVALHDSRSSATRQIDEAGSAIFTRDVVLKDQRFEAVEAVDTLTVVRRKAT